MRSPFLIPGLSEPLSILPGQCLSSIDSVLDTVDGLFYRHSTDRARCVHRSVNGSASANKELHRLNELAVIIIPAPGIKSGYLIPGNAVRDRHRESPLTCHLHS